MVAISKNEYNAFFSLAREAQEQQRNELEQKGIFLRSSTTNSNTFGHTLG